MNQEFHDHLDVCVQCRTHPLDLCRAGVRLLYRQVAEPVSAPRTPTSQEKLDAITIDREHREAAIQHGTASPDLVSRTPTDPTPALDRILKQLAEFPVLQAFTFPRWWLQAVIDERESLAAPLSSRSTPEPEASQGPMVPFLAVLSLWHKWRKALPEKAFTHSDGLKFVRALDDLLAAAPSSPSGASKATE